jgi:hypothetical protein
LNTELDKLKIIDGKIYLYVIDDSIKVYDCITFKEIATLKLPFVRKKPMLLDITENETLLFFAAEKLYFYKINLKESKLTFLLYLSELKNFCYLKNRKEIFLLTELEKSDSILGMAQCDLLGNITFTNKITPKIHYDFKSPEEINNYQIDHIQHYTLSHFSEFNGFNNDKYIINICGYVDDWYDYKISYGQTDIEFEYSIYNNNDNLNELLEKKVFDEDISYFKITDNLFKYINKDRSFYYNEKDNKIEEIDIYNCLIKSLTLFYEDQIESYKEKGYKTFGKRNPDIELKEFKEYDKNIKRDKIKYFYLNDNMFAVFDGDCYLYIIDLSINNNDLKKIELKWIKKDYKDMNIIDIKYSKSDKNEYLYIAFQAIRNNANMKVSGIIKGIILE